MKLFLHSAAYSTSRVSLTSFMVEILKHTSCDFVMILLPGQQSYQLSTFLYPPEPSGEDEDLPELDVSISVPTPLISVEDLSRR